MFLASCSPKIIGKATGQIPQEIAKNPEAYFCPKDDCGKVLESYINSANSSAYCALYDVDLKNVISALAKKSKAADVKLVMDGSNYKGGAKGNGVRLNDGKQLMHNKFCVIDNEIVITGSFNPTDNDNNKNKNNIVIIHSKILAKNYADEFGELWSGEFGRGDNAQYPVLFINNKKIENYFCPEDNCESHVIDLIKNARSSVYFMSFSFTSEEIADALIMNGLEIRGIVDSGQASSKYSQFKRLKEFGINVRKDADKYKMHHYIF